LGKSFQWYIGKIGSKLGSKGDLPPPRIKKMVYLLLIVIQNVHDYKCTKARKLMN
jgi:hypothetical protein